MNKIIAAGSNKGTFKALASGAIAGALLFASACSDETAAGEAPSGSSSLQVQAAPGTTEATGVVRWTAQRDLLSQSMVVAGFDTAGQEIAHIETKGDSRSATVRVGNESFAVDRETGVTKNTLSPASLALLGFVKADLKESSFGDVGPSGPSNFMTESEGVSVSQGALQGKITTTVANCFACWIVTLGTGSTFCYVFGHCDN